MFKPLLRTLPTLSGNIQLDCEPDLTGSDDGMLWTAMVRKARMRPLGGSVYSKKMEVNLGVGSWDFDMARYYRYYSDMFYTSGFTFRKDGWQAADETMELPSRDTAFEFGASRVSLTRDGHQVRVYAPIWCESADDLPDWLDIYIRMNDAVTKTLRIYVGGGPKRDNWLGVYLRRYLGRLKKAVVTCLTGSKQAAYYGVSMEKGGLVTVKDNVAGTLFTDQYTVNTFDGTLCGGYARNAMVMAQALPLAFSFDIASMLTDAEVAAFLGVPVRLSAAWYKDGYRVPMYDFATGYDDFRPPYMGYDIYSGEYRMMPHTERNVMGIGWPGMHEDMLAGYRYSNKLSPSYCRWKLAQSPDSMPYVTNMSFSFSAAGTADEDPVTVYKYGSFPTMSMTEPPYAYVDASGQLLTPTVGNAKVFITENVNNKTDQDIYKEMCGSNTDVRGYVEAQKASVSSWYSLSRDVKDESEYVPVRGGSVMYRGVLYGLGTYAPDMFAVFVDPEVTDTTYTGVYRPQCALSYWDGSTDPDCLVDSSAFLGTAEEGMTPYMESGTKYVYTDSALFNEDGDGEYICWSEYENRNRYMLDSDLKEASPALYDEIEAGGYWTRGVYRVPACMGNIHATLADAGAYKANYTDNGGWADAAYMMTYTAPDMQARIPFSRLTGAAVSLSVHLFMPGRFISAYDLSYRTGNDIPAGARMHAFVPKSVDDGITDAEYFIPCTVRPYSYAPVNSQTEYITYKDWTGDPAVQGAPMYADTWNLDAMADEDTRKHIATLPHVSRYAWFRGTDHIHKYLTHIYEGTDMPDPLADIYVMERTLTRDAEGVIRPSVRYTGLGAWMNGQTDASNTMYMTGDMLVRSLEYDGDGMFSLKCFEEVAVGGALYKEGPYRHDMAGVPEYLTRHDAGGYTWTSYKVSIAAGPVRLCFRKTFVPVTVRILETAGMAGTSVKADDIKTMYLYTQDAGLDGDGLYMKKDETPAALVPEDAYTAPDWPLAPLFADIHVSKADRDRYYDMVTGHDIHPVTAYFTKDVPVTAYRYSVYDGVCFLRMSAAFLKDNPDLRRYSPYDVVSQRLEDMHDTDGITCMDGMNTFTGADGLTYGFYRLKVNLTDTDDTLRLRGANRFLGVDGTPLGTAMLPGCFRRLHPYMKADLFGTFTKLTGMVIEPSEYSIPLRYVPKKLAGSSDDLTHIYRTDGTGSGEGRKYDGDGQEYLSSFHIGSDKDVYEVYDNDGTRHRLNMTRYFGDIMPLITEAPTVMTGRYSLSFRTCDDIIGRDNIYATDIRTDMWRPALTASAYDASTGLVTWKDGGMTQYEHRHFNDSVVYLLPEYMEHAAEGTYLYADLTAADGPESDASTLAAFTECLGEYCMNRTYVENEILFLYKKYRPEYDSSAVKTADTGQGRLWWLTYKFRLI